MPRGTPSCFSGCPRLTGGAYTAKGARRLVGRPSGWCAGLWAACCADRVRGRFRCDDDGRDRRVKPPLAPVRRGGRLHAALFAWRCASGRAQLPSLPSRDRAHPRRGGARRRVGGGAARGAAGGPLQTRRPVLCHNRLAPTQRRHLFFALWAGGSGGCWRSASGWCLYFFDPRVRAVWWSPVVELPRGVERRQASLHNSSLSCCFPQCN